MNQQIDSNDQLTLILQNALNPDMNVRKQAEDQINHLIDQNFVQFLLELSLKISNEKEKKEVRQMSATIIKNMIGKEKYTVQWFQLPEDKRKPIKDNILSTLASEDIDIRKAAALSLAGICKVEIPKGIWIEIFDVLANTCQNNNLYIQLSSLTTLEYIYEEVKPGDIPNKIVANLLNTYYSLLTKENSDPQLSLSTLKSVNKFLNFIVDFINEPNSRIQFYDLIEKNVRNPNVKIREAALQVFIDIAKIYYDSLQEYIDKILIFTKELIEKNDVERNKILCIELWYQIGSEEDFRMNTLNQIKKPSYCFMQKYHLALSEICLKCIVTENYDSDEYNLSDECYYLIGIMSRTCQYNFMQDMIKYIAEYINSNIEKMKYSALNVFRAIICTIHKDSFYQIVKDSLGSVSDILIQSNYPEHFKKLSALILKNITKEYAEEFIKESIYFDKMIDLFLNLIKISSNNVLYFLIFSMNNLCRNVKWSETDETNILSKNMQRLSQPLFQICSNLSYFTAENNVIFAGFLLLGTLGERSANDVRNEMISLFKVLTQLFQGTLNVQNIPDEKTRNTYQEYLASCLTGFLTTNCADEITAANLLKYIIDSFNLRNDLYNEGITLIGCISLFTQENFNAVMDLISPYLIKGLRSLDSPDICKSSVFCLSDIIRSLGVNNKYVNDYLPLIMNILSNDQIDRNLKPQCFNIISDIYIFCPNEAFKSFENIMKIMGDAIQATIIKIDENTDLENMHHFIDLREHILENLTCIFSAVKEIDKTKDFIPFVKCIVNYINTIVNDCANSVTIMLDGLLLLADFCVSYKADIKAILNIEIIKTMISKVENDKNEIKNQDILNNLNWAKQVMNEIYTNY